MHKKNVSIISLFKIASRQLFRSTSKNQQHDFAKSLASFGEIMQLISGKDQHEFPERQIGIIQTKKRKVRLPATIEI